MAPPLDQDASGRDELDHEATPSYHGRWNYSDLLTQVIRRITASGGVQETLETITEEARRLIGAHQAMTSHTVADDWRQPINAISLSERYPAWGDYDVSPDGSGVDSLVCQNNEPMRLTQAELEAHPAYKGFGEADRHPPMRGWLAVPLIGRDGYNVGLVRLSDKYDGGDFTEGDENVLVQLAQVAAIALENAQLYESRQQAYDEVHAERRQLAEIFRNAPSFMCVLAGSDHVFERANDQYMGLVGHRDIIGRPAREALPEVVEQGFIDLLDSVYRTGEPHVSQDAPVRLFPPDADGPIELSLDFVYQPIRDADGTITGIYVQGVDLTERKRIEEALRASEQRLQEANESLEGRVAARTGQLRALAAELTQAEQRERRRLSNLLHDHVQQLLVAGKIQLESAAAQVGEAHAAQAMGAVQHLLERAIEDTRSLTAELSPPVLYDAGLAAGLEWLGRWMREHHGLETDLDAAESAEPAEEELRVLLFQAIRELLFNVVKHAQTNRAQTFLRRGEDGSLEAGVVDAGVGFDPTAAKDASASAEDHFGLLSLRERFEWHGGEMTIESAPGSGTRAYLRVPDERARAEGTSAWTEQPRRRESDPNAPTAQGAGTVQPGETPPIQVVLADDHTIIREALANALAGEADIAVVGEASDGQEAVDLVRRIQPDVAVLDISMPKMGGLEAARVITAEFHDIRVIGLSVHDDADMAEAMRDAGAIAYVNKAESPDHLLKAIRGVPEHT